MDRKKLEENIGNIVAYTDRNTGDVYPAKVLDASLWEVYYRPEKRVRLSRQRRASRVLPDCKVGYPVLMPQRGVRHSPEQARELLRWLAETPITMADLFDERGVERNPPRWSENERAFFTVVFPEDTRENYPGVAREAKEKRAARDARLKALEEEAAARHEAAVALSNSLASAGFTSPDQLPIVTEIHVRPPRVSVAVDVLEELARVALPLLSGCGKCGTHDYLLPYERATDKTWMLCASCHPRVH